MAADGSTKAVVTALAANMGIAVSKFTAAAITGSSSMLAEGVHSVADSANQALLLLGGKRARRAPTREHPFGYGRERYVYAFIVSIVLFTLGGLYALYEGWSKLSDPHALSSPLIAVAVLVLAIALEGWAFRTAVKEAAKLKGDQSWIGFIRHAKAPELPTILLEDAGAVVGLVTALAGVGLTVLTGNAIFDAIATLVIGVLLVVIAVVLATETKSLLLGEAAGPREVAAIRAAISAEPVIDHVIHLKTVHIGPEEILVAAKIAIDRTDNGDEITAAINGAEAAIRLAVPTATQIYLEPDILREPAANTAESVA